MGNRTFSVITFDNFGEIAIMKRGLKFSDNHTLVCNFRGDVRISKRLATLLSDHLHILYKLHVNLFL